MSWSAVRLPLLLGIGFALPALLVAGLKALPKDYFAQPPLPKEPEVQVKMQPVRLVAKSPEVGFDPFKTILDAPVKTPAQPTLEDRPEPATQPREPQAAPPAERVAQEANLPDPKLEGVVGGDDPVAVINIDGDSHFARIGQTIAGGIYVISITDSEVRLRRGNTELVLKTGLR